MDEKILKILNLTVMESSKKEMMDERQCGLHKQYFCVVLWLKNANCKKVDGAGGWWGGCWEGDFFLFCK